MRRTGLLIAGWALATLLALVLGLQGVNAISDSVTSHPKASLSPGSVKAALDRSTASSTDETSTEEASTDSSDVVSTASSTAASSAADTHVAPVPSAEPEPAPAPAPDEGSSSSEESSESQASATTQAPEDRTYQLIGGTVGVRFENGGAHLLWATPNTGFSVDSSSDSSSVDVRFESDSHESRLKAFWNDGPQQEIEERNAD